MSTAPGRNEPTLELPQPVVDRLREVIRRLRKQQLLRGLLMTLAAGAGSSLVIMALDAGLSLESRLLRTGLTLAGLAATARVAWTCGVRPLRRRISLAAVAGWIEHRHPELQERISTAVELLGPGKTGQTRNREGGYGSRALMEAVLLEAVEDAGRMNPARQVSPRRLRPAKWLAAAGLGILLVSGLIWPAHVPGLFVRAWAPLAETGNAWAGSLRVLTTSRVMALRDPLTVEAALRSGRPERVELHLTLPDGGTLVEMMTPGGEFPLEPGEEAFSLRMPEVRGSFTARVVAGRAVSAPFTIMAVERPEAAGMTLTYAWPEYTGWREETRAGVSGEIAALAGTRVTVRAALNRSAAKAVVRIGGKEVSGVESGQDAAGAFVRWQTILPAGLETEWSLELTDGDGVRGRVRAFPLRSLADQPPEITLETPAEDPEGKPLELRPVEQLPLTYQVREDVGLASVRIRLRSRTTGEHVLPPSPLPDKLPDGPDAYQGMVLLDLARLPQPVAEGDEIRVSLQAEDRLPAALQGPQQAWSREVTVVIRQHARPLIEKNFDDQHRGLQRAMQEVRNELQSARGRLNDKPERLRHEESLSSNTLRDIEDSMRHMDNAEERLAELTARMRGSAYARQAAEMEKIAREMVAPARQLAREIPLADEKEQRAAMAKNTNDLLERAMERIGQQQRRMDEDRESVGQAARLSDIASQQQLLADQARQAAAVPSAAPPPAEAEMMAVEAARQRMAAQELQHQQQPMAASTPAGGNQPPDKSGNPAASSPDAGGNTARLPTPEEQKKWLEAQERVASRAHQLLRESKNDQGPAALLERLRQARAETGEMAAQAARLSEQQTALVKELESLPPQTLPASDKIAAQQNLAAQAERLQEKIRSLQETAGRPLSQNTETQDAAHESLSHIGAAAAEARQSGDELTAAATTSSTPSGGAPETAAEIPKTETAPVGTPETAGEGPPPGSAETAAASAGGKTGPDAQTAMDLSAGPGPAEAAASEAARRPGPPGTASAARSAGSLAKAGESLTTLGNELDELAAMLGQHHESLEQGAGQAGTAAGLARKAQQEADAGGEKNGAGANGMAKGAEAARQAAERLSLAATTAMENLGIPPSAKTMQAAAASQSKSRSQAGQPNSSPSTPGQDGRAGPQMDTASSALPPELRRLGLSQDDWTRLRSSLDGVEASQTGRIPEEYRDLVKAYFGALAAGGTPVPVPAPSPAPKPASATSGSTPP